MRRVFRAAHDRTTAYVGAGDPEPTRLPNDWRRFLDLTEELGGASGISDLMATWVVPSGQRATLAARAKARDDYHVLVADGGSWAAPVVIRLAMDGWSFDKAESGMRVAMSILSQRDATASLAATLKLAPPSGLEPAYEGADSEAGLASAATLASNTETSLEAVQSAVAAAAAPRDWLDTLGLVGKDPDGLLADARAAWQQGDLAQATEAAGLVTGTLAVAGEAGRGRAIVIVCGVAILLLLISLVALGYRQRRRRRALRLARAAAAVAPGPAIAGPSLLAPSEAPAAPSIGASDAQPPMPSPPVSFAESPWSPAAPPAPPAPLGEPPGSPAEPPGSPAEPPGPPPASRTPSEPPPPPGPPDDRPPGGSPWGR